MPQSGWRTRRCHETTVRGHSYYDRSSYDYGRNAGGSLRRLLPGSERGPSAGPACGMAGHARPSVRPLAAAMDTMLRQRRDRPAPRAVLGAQADETPEEAARLLVPSTANLQAQDSPRQPDAVTLARIRGRQSACGARRRAAWRQQLTLHTVAGAQTGLSQSLVYCDTWAWKEQLVPEAKGLCTLSPHVRWRRPKTSQLFKISCHLYSQLIYLGGPHLFGAPPTSRLRVTLELKRTFLKNTCSRKEAQQSWQ